MQRIPVSTLVLVFSFGFLAHAQLAATSADAPRIYVTDSNSWSVRGSAGGSNGVFGASSSGGAQPQTAEIIKTFGQRCPQVTVNNRVDVSNYIVELDHEGGKGALAHKDKIAVFVQRTGDSIFSKSTLSVGGSVQDACAAILNHWAAHSTELRAVASAPVQAAAVAAAAPVAQATSITVDASAPNCDIEVDGSFVGSTPSTINLTPGKHEVVVKKTGYKDWSRSMTVTSGTIRVSADMVSLQ
jgi:PEGA domain